MEKKKQLQPYLGIFSAFLTGLILLVIVYEIKSFFHSENIAIFKDSYGNQFFLEDGPVTIQKESYWYIRSVDGQPFSLYGWPEKGIPPTLYWEGLLPPQSVISLDPNIANTSVSVVVAYSNENLGANLEKEGEIIDSLLITIALLLSTGALWLVVFIDHFLNPKKEIAPQE